MEEIGNSELAKSIGYKSAEEMYLAIGVSSQTLTNWKKTKPKTYLAVVAGAEKLKKDEQNGNSRNKNGHRNSSQTLS